MRHRACNIPMHAWPARRAFTVIELMIVVTIIVLSLAATYPIYAQMARSSQRTQTLSAVQVAVATAQSTALKQVAFERGSYSGAAAIFTPFSEIRIVENTGDAIDQNGDYLEDLGLNGYRDVEGREYITIPNEYVAIGIARGDSGTEPLLFMPPFAIRFNATGHLIANHADPVSGEQADWFVYYNGAPTGSSTDGLYQTAGLGTDGGHTRVAFYDSDASPFDSNGYHEELWRRTYDDDALDDTDALPLPYERLETVIGVLVINRDDLNTAAKAGGWDLWSNSTHGGLEDDATSWLIGTNPDTGRYNAEMILFNRYSGTPIRDLQ